MNNKPKLYLYLAFVQAVLAIAGSLYASQVLHWTPCDLCWWQRIFMYPLVILLALGIKWNTPKLPLLLMPMSVIGGLIAFYHVMLQAGVIRDSGICSATIISCAVGTQKFLGIATLPQLSLIAFVVITVCLILASKKKAI